MKYLLLAAVALSGLPLAVTTDCNANNCLRAVRATARATRFGLDDCFSYLKVTVTPVTHIVTETATATVSVTPIVYYSVTESRLVLVTATEVDPRTYTSFTSITRTTIGLAKRQATVIPSAIPAYASTCSESVHYSSACFYIGATATTVTVAAPESTVTETATATVSPTTISLPTTVTTVSVTTTADTTTITATVTTVGGTVEDVRTFTAPARCASLAARNQLYTQGAPAREIRSLDRTALFPFNEEGRSQCCGFCYTIPNCSVFFFASGQDGIGSCRIYVNTAVVDRNQSPQCPAGIVEGATVSPVAGGPNGFGLGPCYRDVP